MKESQRERSRQSRWHLQKPSGRLEVGTPESWRKGQCGGLCGGGGSRMPVSGNAQALFSCRAGYSARIVFRYEFVPSSVKKRMREEG